MTELQKIESFRKDLAVAETFDEIKLHQSAADALAEFARKEQISLDKQNEIGEFRIEVSKKLGQWLNDHFPQGGNGSNQYAKVDRDDHSKMPVSKDQSSRDRNIATAETEDLLTVMHDISERGEVITPGKVNAGLKRLHVQSNSGNNEWYTPEYILTSAREVLGEIDLDPASSEKANESVKAEFFFTIEDNGLDQDWGGKIWMNPPYSQPEIGQFIDKLVGEYVHEYIVLVNNATETKWGQTILTDCDYVCFPSGRIRYLTPEGDLRDSPLQGQMLCYKGDNGAGFVTEFSKYGKCLMAIR